MPINFAGNCLAHAVIASIEALHFLVNGTWKEFSIQELTDRCSHNWWDVARWVEKHGVCLATDYPESTETHATKERQSVCLIFVSDTIAYIC